MTNEELRADCARCAALCCVAFAFEPSDAFAFAKAAAEPCRHLDAANRCRIHDRRAEMGMRGCQPYTCHGAGQYVTQALFAGQSGRDDPALRAAMAEAFADMARVQSTLAMARVVLRIGAPVPDKLHALMRRLVPPEGWTREALAGGAGLALEREFHALLAELTPEARAAVAAALTRPDAGLPAGPG
jgi:hypothetical protein